MKDWLKKMDRYALVWIAILAAFGAWWHLHYNEPTCEDTATDVSDCYR